MKVLVVGKGGREHAIVHGLSRSPSVTTICAAPGNPGIARDGECVPELTEPHAIAQWAEAQAVDLVFIGPENYLAAGLVDELEARGVKAVGPRQGAARLESSKIFAKELMARRGVPTASFAAFDDAGEALRHVGTLPEGPVVVKADGLAAGKGVIVCRDRREAEGAVRRLMEEEAFGSAGRRIIVEEFLQGEEASLLAFTDGETILPLLSAQDHKRLGDGDTGPNTGGMGAYSPAPVLGDEVAQAVIRDIMRPVIEELAAIGHPYRGVLYAGLMLTSEGPKVLEFNCRLGDPETQAVLPLLETDLGEVGQAVAEGRLHEITLRWRPGSAACVVVAAPGYPDDPVTGDPISGLDEVEGMDDVLVFHAGTAQRDGRIVTAGGRVLGVTGIGATLQEALGRAYDGVARIAFPGMQYRRDIGSKALQSTPGDVS